MANDIGLKLYHMCLYSFNHLVQGLNMEEIFLGSSNKHKGTLTERWNPTYYKVIGYSPILSANK